MKNSRKNIDETVEKMLQQSQFLDIFPNIIKDEASNFGKLILQENYISTKVLALKHFLQMCHNQATAYAFDKGYISHLMVLHLKDANFLTLGKLIQELEIFVFKDKGLIRDLQKYTELRNNITHKILEKYTSIKAVEKDAEALVPLGEKIIDLLGELIDTFAKDFVSMGLAQGRRMKQV